MLFLLYAGSHDRTPSLCSTSPHPTRLYSTHPLRPVSSYYCTTLCCILCRPLALFVHTPQHLDPLPDLPDTNEGFFNGDFNAQVLDLQYPTAANETPFPTWGNVSSNNLAAMGANASATSAASATTASATVPVAATPPIATNHAPIGALPAIEQTTATPSAAPNPPAIASESIQLASYTAAVAPAAAAGTGTGATIGTCLPERHVFLRERLGGESVSSGNSSTSNCSDNGSGSDDTAPSGEWESKGSSAAVGDSAVRDSAMGSVINGGNAINGVVGNGGSTTATNVLKKPATRRKRQSSGDGSQMGTVSRKAAKREIGMAPGASERLAADSGFGGGESYRSWSMLVQPLTQQWDHVEAPPTVAAAPGAETATSSQANNNKSSVDKPFSGDCCRVFSKEPRPHDLTYFSVEQCSAQAHPTAVASYILRVRCAGGAHIVRRTWDDLAALCTMVRNAATAGVVAADFAPADVLAVDAASGFLTDILLQPDMAISIPVRRFLELEFLDGTLRGGRGDCGREKAARVVASMAAGAAQSAAAAAGLAGSATSLVVPPNAFEPATAAATGLIGGKGLPTATAEGSMASATGLRLEGAMRVLVAGRGGVPSIPSHPDAARDLAAVCRCLGELGAAAFMSVPRAAGGAVSYWGSKDAAGTNTAAATGGGGTSSGGRGGGATVGAVAPQRGKALVA